MRFGHRDGHCVKFKGKSYRVEVVRGESFVGTEEATLWIGQAHKTLTGHVDDVRVARVAEELLRECERAGTLNQLDEDPNCQRFLVQDGSSGD